METASVASSYSLSITECVRFRIFRYISYDYGKSDQYHIDYKT